MTQQVVIDEIRQLRDALALSEKSRDEHIEETIRLRAVAETAEKERDAMLSAAGATPPDQEVFRRFQRLHGLPEVGYPDWENRGKAAEADAKRLREALDEADKVRARCGYTTLPDGSRSTSVVGPSEWAGYDIARAALAGEQP